MSAKKLSTYSNTNSSVDETLYIQWGHITRSQTVEDHIRDIADKIFERTNEATNLVVHLNVDLASKQKPQNIIKVGFELRFPKHQDLFCHSEGENLYETLASCKQQILRMMVRRKKTKLKNRVKKLDFNFDLEL